MSWAAVACPPLELMSQTSTLQPSEAKRRAIPAPKPDPAPGGLVEVVGWVGEGVPVTIATLPSSLPIVWIACVLYGGLGCMG